MVHIGDQLFFLYAILSLSKIKKVYIVNNGYVAPFWSKLNLLISEDQINFSFDLIVPSYSFSSISNCQLKNSHNCKTIFFYDFNDNTIQEPLGKHIYSFFSDMYGLDNNFAIEDYEISLPPISHLGIGCKYVVFNETINSGFFRKFFLNTDVFSSYLKKFKQKGFKIVLIGSDQDLISKNNNFIDFDLRGKLSLIEIFSLFSSSQCAYYLGYDNAFMHIACYSDKSSIILFRGRFSKSSRELHYRSINVALCRGDNMQKIKYIK